MPAQHGGYRKPTSPAPVSGPGSLSRRTDGGPAQVQSVPTGMDYGDHAALQAQEQIAPMAGTPNTPNISVPPPGGQPGMPQPSPSGQPVTPIGAPTQRPNEPITAGVDIGDGPGASALPMEHTDTFQSAGPMTQMLQQLSASDTSGVLSQLFLFAKAQGA